MNTFRSHPIAPIARMASRVAFGAILAAGTVAVPLTASAQAPATRAPAEAECLPLLCVNVDIGLGIDLGILGGGLNPLAPTPTTPPPTAPTTPSTPLSGIVDVDLGINAEVGNVAVVDATVPVDVEVGSSPQRPLAVGANSSPDVSATVGRRGARPLADVDVSSVDVVAEIVVPGAGASSGAASPGLLVADLTDISCLVGVAVIGTTGATCSGSALIDLDAGIATVGAGIDLCNVSVVVLGATDRATCATAGGDPTDDAADDPSSDAADDPATDPTESDSDAAAANGPGGDDSSQGVGNPAGIRRNQAEPGDESGLAVTGSSVLLLLALGAAATAAGAGGLVIKRRRPTA